MCWFGSIHDERPPNGKTRRGPWHLSLPMLSTILWTCTKTKWPQSVCRTQMSSLTGILCAASWRYMDIVDATGLHWSCLTWEREPTCPFINLSPVAEDCTSISTDCTECSSGTSPSVKVMLSYHESTSFALVQKSKMVSSETSFSTMCECCAPCGRRKGLSHGTSSMWHEKGSWRLEPILVTLFKST